ncbi:MAG: hypothetical protein NTY30_00350 [Candidatus Berkelbacteria bacterium]|nr:hypothetical protein [Candidatus Berkelbacteria bacterium]
MKQMIVIVSTVLVFMAVIYFTNFGVENKSNADTQNVTVSATVLTAMTFSTTAGSTAAFGSLTPGSPIAAPATGTVLSVTTNAANGYTIGVSDAVAGSDSALHQSSTYIADYAGTIATPTTWTGTGLGVTLFAADTGKNTTQWGAGTTYNDVLNQYAGIPETATTAHTVTGYHSSADTSSWDFKLDVPGTQKTGAYSGTVTFTATAVLS